MREVVLKKIKKEDKRISKVRKEVVGKLFKVNCGWTAKVESYEGYYKTKVRWLEDNTTQIVRLDTLRSGELKPTNAVIDRSKQDLVDKAGEKYLGKSFKVNCGWTCKVIKYEGKKGVTVKWEEDGNEQVVTSNALISKTAYPKSLQNCGIGCVDLEKHEVEDQYLTRWRGLIMRCNNKNYQVKNKTYKNVSVCEEWEKYSNFQSWAKTWGDISGLHLDKDALSGKTYSPETCIFVPPYLNYLFRLPRKRFFDRGKVLEVNVSGKYIGTYTSEVCAEEAYNKVKVLEIVEKVEEYKKEEFFDERVIVAIITWAKNNFPEELLGVLNERSF